MCPKHSSSRIALEYEFSFLFRPIHAKTIIMLRSVKSSIEFENSVGIGAESAVREPGRIRPDFFTSDSLHSGFVPSENPTLVCRVTDFRVH
ncbi:hypothetical protein QMN03_15325 [Leptospira santarosai]|uniref:hypothetical protein n=1 Tax=Leptospira santarosai TaxID=28183 RepID=UPI0024AF516A|nr:hypothetical protein [Leptospira santarosai]MDI7208255.1 hypothetical protein [Leptospira santarosai]